MDPQQLEKLRASAGTRTGGKGTPRRNVKVASKASGAGEKDLDTFSKKMGMQQINGIEQANFFHNDGTILHFQKPKVSALMMANFVRIQGNGQVKQLEELMPDIINQMGADHIQKLKRLAEQFQQSGGVMPPATAAAPEDDDDDDVPELVENIDENAN